MIKKLLLLAVATLALTSCYDSQAKRHHPSMHKVAPVHHFSDGRWGYQDDSGDWFIYYMIVTQNTSPTYYTYPSYSTGGVWTKATTPPTNKEISEASVEEVEVDVGADGRPVDTPEEAEAAETNTDTDTGNEPADAGTDNGGDAGGGDAGGGDGGGGGGGE